MDGFVTLPELAVLLQGPRRRRLSTDGALIIRTDHVWHEFGGDYYDTAVRDGVTGALLQRFSDHPVTPSADGTRLFGNDGAVFCR